MEKLTSQLLLLALQVESVESANESFAQRQVWWNDKMFELEERARKLAEVNAEMFIILREARNYLFNPFEPDNQSIAYKRVDEMIKKVENETQRTENKDI